MLIDKKLAEDFLFKYQMVMVYLNNGEIPNGMLEFGALRAEIYECLEEIKKNMTSVVTADFIESLEKAIFGRFVYLKKYKDGYVFLHVDTGKYYQVVGLTSPIEEICSEYSMVDTAILSFSQHLICDGLIAPYDSTFGSNIIKEFRNGYWEAKKNGSLIKII